MREIQKRASKLDRSAMHWLLQKLDEDDMDTFLSNLPGVPSLAFDGQETRGRGFDRRRRSRVYQKAHHDVFKISRTFARRIHVACSGLYQFLMINLRDGISILYQSE